MHRAMQPAQSTPPIRPILVVGDVNVDLSAAAPFYPHEGGEVTLDGLRWGAGGAGINTASGLALLGAKARLLARVGEDAPGRQALDLAGAAGVDLRLVQADAERPTGLVFAAVSPGGDRTFFAFRGANVACDTHLDDAQVAELGLVHISAYALLEGPQREAALRVAAQAQRLGVPLSLDLAPPPIQRGRATLLELLPQLTALFLNAQELAALLPDHAPDEGLAALRDRYRLPLVALKQGPSGCTVLTREGGWTLDALEVAACDSTGCGDAFVAGFLYAWARSAPPLTCAALGNLLGGLTATGYGSANALPTRSQTITLARSVGGAPYTYVADVLQSHDL
jgi:ribokinase